MYCPKCFVEAAHVLEVLLFSLNLPDEVGELSLEQVRCFDHVLAAAMGAFTHSSLLHGRVKRIYKQFFLRTDLPAHKRSFVRTVSLVVIVDASEIFVAAVRMLDVAASRAGDA